MAIANDGRGILARSVESLAELACLPEALPRAALVGGLAVMVRLYEAHRATTDFDEVSEERDETIAVLVARGAKRTANGVLLADHGVQLDLLDARSSLSELSLLLSPGRELDDVERGAVQLGLVCRYALENATNTEILVMDDTTIISRVTFPVAVAGALVAMKLHAAGQRERKPEKAAGDIYDAFRLIRAWGPSVIAEDLSRAPLAMLEVTATQIREIFIDGAERSARKLRSSAMPGVDSVTISDLESMGEVVEALEPFRQWDV